MRLDDQPYRIAVEQAEAQLASVRLQVEGLRATYRQRLADLASAQETFNYQQREYERQRQLLKNHVISQAQFTLAAELRAEGAGIFTLVRNIGGSIGISIVETIAERMTQRAHASLASLLTPFDPVLRLPQVQQVWNMQSASGLAALNQEVTRQASMIAYTDDFKLMMIVTLSAIPLLLLLRRGDRAASGDAAPTLH